MRKLLLAMVVAALVFMSHEVGRTTAPERELRAVNYASTPMVDVCTFYDNITDVQPPEMVSLDNWYSILIDNLARLLILAAKSENDVLTENAHSLILSVVTGDTLMENNARAGLTEACTPRPVARGKVL